MPDNYMYLYNYSETIGSKRWMEPTKEQLLRRLANGPIDWGQSGAIMPGPRSGDGRPWQTSVFNKISSKCANKLKQGKI